MQDVVEDPRRNLPVGHKLSNDEVEDLVGRSTTRLSEKVYRLILDYMDNQGHMKKLEFIVQSVADLRVAAPKAKKKGTAMINAAVTQGGSQQGIGSDSTGGPGNRMADPCASCGMFCHPPQEGCILVSNGKFIPRNVASLKGAIFKPQGGGQWSLHHNFILRFRRHGLSHLNIASQQEQGKIIDEINKVVKNMYEQSKSGGNTKSVNSAVAVPNVSTTGEKQTKKKKKKKKKRQKKAVEDDSSGEEDEGAEGAETEDSVFD